MRLITITISDAVDAGNREDLSGEHLKQAVRDAGWELVESTVIPDDRKRIEALLRALCDEDRADVILTSGGTGLGPRDVTPEAMGAVIDRNVPGIAEAMRAYGMQKTPFAMLSRSVAGARGKALIVSMPGNPKAVREGLEVILPVLPHAVEILRGQPSGPEDHPRFPHSRTV